LLSQIWIGFTHTLLISSPFHQLRTYLTFARVFHPYGIEILNYSADPVRLKCIRTLLLSFFSDEQGDSTPAVEHSHLLVAISLEGETLRWRSFWQREQQLCHLRSTIPRIAQQASSLQKTLAVGSN